MQEKLWVFRPSDIALQNNLSRQLSISPVTASVLRPPRLVGRDADLARSGSVFTAITMSMGSRRRVSICRSIKVSAGMPVATFRIGFAKATG